MHTQIGSIMHYFSLDIFQRPQRWRTERCQTLTDGSIVDQMEGYFASTAAGTGLGSRVELRSGGASCT